ncbi:InlB B-repeat-containing protein [Bifidobacterium aquikefiri]|uniref:InlB B-repeat-containing protein n=1 Tax=Bifidobacterium aquikefiri TaxID=1653207 RepID=UPI0039E9B041
MKHGVHKQETSGGGGIFRLLVTGVTFLGLTFGALVSPAAFAVEENDSAQTSSTQTEPAAQPTGGTAQNQADSGPPSALPGNTTDAAEPTSELPDSAVELNGGTVLNPSNEDASKPSQTNQDADANEATNDESADDETGSGDTNNGTSADSNESEDASGSGWIIGEEEVTEVVEDTIDFTFADLFVGWDEDVEDEYWSYTYKTIESKDGRAAFNLRRSVYRTSENQNTTVQGQISDYSVRLSLIKSNTDASGEVIDFEENYFWLYDLSTDRSEKRTAYLRDGDELIEYQLTLNYQGTSQTPSETLDVEFSESESGKQTQTKDGLVAYTPDYEHRNFDVASLNSDWLLFEDSYTNGTRSLENQTVYLEQEHLRYQYYLYNSKTEQVKIYRLNLTNVVSEVPEDVLDISVNRNNRWPAGTEVYTQGTKNPNFQVVSGYTYGRYEFAWSLQTADSYQDSGTFYHSITSELTHKLSFVEYQTWEDEDGDEHLVRLNIVIDDTVPETVKDKEFTQDVAFADIDGKVKAVDLAYNEHRTVTKYITFDANGDYKTWEYNEDDIYEEVSTKNRFIALYCYTDYYENSQHCSVDETLDEISSHVYEHSNSSSYEANYQYYRVTGLPNKPEETLHLELGLTDFAEQTITSSDEMISFSGNHASSGASYLNTAYYLSYGYDYDGVYAYRTYDFEHSVADDGDGAAPITKTFTVYQVKNRVITKVYTIDYSLESRKYVEKPEFSIALSQRDNWDYMEEKTATNSDGVMTSFGYFERSEYADTSYSSMYENYRASITSANTGVLIDAPYLYKWFDHYYSDGVLTGTYEGGTTQDIAYAYDTQTGEYAKHPVSLDIDTAYVDPDTLPRKSVDVLATEHDLIPYQGTAGKEFSASIGDRSITFKIFKDKYHIYGSSGDVERPGDLYIGEYSANYGPVAKQLGENAYQLLYRAGVDVNLTITGKGADEIVATDISLAKSEVVVDAKNSQYLDLDDFLSITPENPTVNYIDAESDNTDVASVYAYSNGIYVYGYKPGSTTVTVTTANGKSAKFTVIVKSKTTSIADIPNKVVEEATGITVAAESNNVLPKGAVLSVAKLDAEETAEQNKAVYDKVNALTNGKFELFDINLVNEEEDKNVQPNGQVAVYMPIPDGFDPAKVKVYHYDAKINKREKVSGYVDEIDGKLYYVFYTDHFSYYVMEEAASYKVSFDANGGELEAEQASRDILGTDAIGSLPVPQRDGYVFDGWFTAQSDGEQISATTVVSDNTTFYAHWTKVDVSVTSVALTPASAELVAGETAQLTATVSPSNATVKDVIFASSDGGVAAVDATGKVTANKAGKAVITVTTQDGAKTAQSEITVTSKQFTVTFNPNGGSLGLADATRTVADGSKVGSLPEPTLAAFTFDGWYTAASAGTKINADTVISADTTFFAHWSNSVLPPGGDDEDPVEEPADNPPDVDSKDDESGDDQPAALDPAALLPTEALNDSNRGTASGSPVAAAGSIYRISLGKESSVHVGELVFAYIYSDPVLLTDTNGRKSHIVQQASDGTLFIDVKLPADYSGEHKIAVYDADGRIVGWVSVTLASTTKQEKTESNVAVVPLAATGSSIGRLMWLTLVAAGLSTIIFTIRRRGLWQR